MYEREGPREHIVVCVRGLQLYRTSLYVDFILVFPCSGIDVSQRFRESIMGYVRDILFPREVNNWRLRLSY